MNTSSKAQFAQRLRDRMTPSEKKLWQRLRKNQLGHRFTRQKIISGWIADFHCSARNLVVEVDGGYHKFRRKQDAVRDFVIARHGIRTIRIMNEEIAADLDAVVAKIKAAMDEEAKVHERGKLRTVPPTNGKPIGIFIKRLIQKGYTYREAVPLAFEMAQNGNTK